MQYGYAGRYYSWHSPLVSALRRKRTHLTPGVSKPQKTLEYARSRSSVCPPAPPIVTIQSSCGGGSTRS